MQERVPRSKGGKRRMDLEKSAVGISLGWRTKKKIQTNSGALGSAVQCEAWLAERRQEWGRGKFKRRNIRVSAGR